jgi:hypothetical protein
VKTLLHTLGVSRPEDNIALSSTVVHAALAMCSSSRASVGGSRHRHGGRTCQGRP